MTSTRSRFVRSVGLAFIALALAGCGLLRPPPLRISVYAKVDSAPDAPPPPSPTPVLADQATEGNASPDKPCHDPKWQATPVVATTWPKDQDFRVGYHVALVHAFPVDLDCVTLTLDAQLVPVPGVLGDIGVRHPKFDESWQLRVRHLRANRLYVWSIEQFLTSAKQSFDHCHVVTRIDITCDNDVCPKHLDLPLELPDPTALDMVSDCGSQER